MNWTNNPWLANMVRHTLMSHESMSVLLIYWADYFIKKKWARGRRILKWLCFSTNQNDFNNYRRGTPKEQFCQITLKLENDLQMILEEFLKFCQFYGAWWACVSTNKYDLKTCFRGSLKEHFCQYLDLSTDKTFKALSKKEPICGKGLKPYRKCHLLVV